jgi:tRNA nucleotidyltransferase (CCA-adding enzyme)
MRAIRILKTMSQDTPAEIYYAGEYARDIIRRQRSGKVEILVRNLPFQRILSYLKKHFNNIYVAKNKGSLSFLSDHAEITVTLPRKDKKYGPYHSLRDDARLRGFTINAMYLPIASKKRDSIIDFYRGRQSIKSRKIRTIGKSDKAIRKNPSLILGAIALSAKLNYRIDNNLFYAIKTSPELVEKVDIEEVRDRFTEVILSSKPSRYLKIMHDANLLGQLIPELDVCYGIDQNKKYHKYDVFEHCLIACDNTEPVLPLRLAALFHDIGKAPTRDEAMKDGALRVTFYNHEVVGAKITKRVLRRLRYDKALIHEVSELVYNHMYNYEPSLWTDAAVRRFIKKVHITEANLRDLDSFPLFLVRRADRMANGQGLSEVAPRQHAFQTRINQVYNRSEALHITDLDIDGTDIMTHFKLGPGPTIGHVLNYLLTLVIEDQSLNTKPKLLGEASKYLSKALK